MGWAALVGLRRIFHTYFCDADKNYLFPKISVEPYVTASAYIESKSMNNIELRIGNRPFFDDIHFPRGFNRSGEFTIFESKIMQDYGDTMKRLADGDLEPINEEEKRFVRCASGEQEATTVVEKAWRRYKQLIAPKMVVTLHGRGYLEDFDEDYSDYSVDL